MEQRLNVLQNKQISSEAYQLSTGYQLGAPQDELKVSVTIKRILGGIVCLVFYPIIFGSWRIYICSEGFIYKRGMKIDVFRWNHIEAAWVRVIKHYRNGIYAGTTHRYTVLRKDGLKITLNDKFSGIERLGDRISQEVTNHLLPRVITDYHAGRSVFFGPLQVNIQGISTINQQLPWARVQEISIIQGVLKVREKGEFRDRVSVQADQVPNIFVLTALVNYILKDPAQRV